MNYEQAVKIHFANRHLVGKMGRYVNHPISNILILPLDNEKVVLERILTSNPISQPGIVQFSGTKEYCVVVIFEIEGHFTFQDISLYINQEIEI